MSVRNEKNELFQDPLVVCKPRKSLRKRHILALLLVIAVLLLRQLSDGPKDELAMKYFLANDKLVNDVSDYLWQLGSDWSRRKDDEYLEVIVNRSLSLWNMGRPAAQPTHHGIKTTAVTPRCALNFYGLPRAFRNLVLPSVIQHILLPNAAYHCDIFVYFHDTHRERGGRSGSGGRLNPRAVLLLKPAVELLSQGVLKHDASRNKTGSVAVIIDSFSTPEFQLQRADVLQKLRNNHSYYMPAKATGFKNETLRNVAIMWHSIQGVWNLMESYARNHSFMYEQVATFRADVVYTTPIDIFSAGTSIDTSRRLAVVPGFARFPVNDRMMYGPYGAVQIYANQRFALMEHHVASMVGQRRNGLHPEMMLERTIFPKIRSELNVSIFEDSSLCFVRARADESIWVDDCTKRRIGSGPSLNETLEQVQLTLNRVCTTEQFRRGVTVATCRVK